MEVTDELVLHVARLSRLAISESETRELKSHFQKVLAFISAFQELDTASVDPSLFSVDASNVFRDDEPCPSLPRADALASAPASDGVYFVVPRIVGGDAGSAAPQSGGAKGEAAGRAELESGDDDELGGA